MPVPIDIKMMLLVKTFASKIDRLKSPIQCIHKC